MPVIVKPNEDASLQTKPQRIIILMKKVVDINSPDYTAIVKEIQDLYAKGVFDEILLLRDEDETYFKLFENEYVIATLKDMDYLKQKINSLTKAFSDHKKVVDKTLDYLKSEMFNVKGKIYFLEEETSKQKATLEELKRVTKSILDFVKKLVENNKYLELKARVEKTK